MHEDLMPWLDGRQRSDESCAVRVSTDASWPPGDSCCNGWAPLEGAANITIPLFCSSRSRRGALASSAPLEAAAPCRPRTHPTFPTHQREASTPEKFCFGGSAEHSLAGPAATRFDHGGDSCKKDSLSSMGNSRRRRIIVVHFPNKFT